jgi:hypothetical protein
MIDLEGDSRGNCQEITRKGENYIPLEIQASREHFS